MELVLAIRTSSGWLFELFDPDKLFPEPLFPEPLLLEPFPEFEDLF